MGQPKEPESGLTVPTDGPLAALRDVEHTALSPF